MTSRQSGQLPNYRWIKFDLSLLDEPLFMRLPAAIKGIYLLLYLLAGKADAGGLLCNSHQVYEPADLAYALHLDETEVKTAINTLQSSGFLAAEDNGYKIVRFLDEQGPGDNEQREKWRIRQEKSRKRARGEAETETEKTREEVDEMRIDNHGDVTVTERQPTSPLFISYPQMTNTEFTLAKIMKVDHFNYPTEILRQKLIENALRLQRAEFEKAVTAILEKTDDLTRIVDYIAKWQPKGDVANASI